MKELPNPTFALSPLNLPRGSLHPAQSNSAVDFLPRRAKSAIEVSWAKHQDEVREAQRLRFDIFGNEMGARLSTKVPGHDIDLFDDYCEHLLVRESETGQVIGTYRVLTPEQAKRAGSTYSDTEFDLTRLRDMRSRMVELGRSCVHPDHRHGGVIMALWGALAWLLMAATVWAIERSRTTLTHEGLLQTWLWDKKMAMRELAFARLIRFRGFDWLIAPRLYVRNLSGKFTVIYCADRAMLEDMQRLCTELHQFRTSHM